MSENNKQPMGQRIIREEDVVNVGRKDNVMSLIRNRFDMTLNLDKRYLVIVYSIIADARGAQPFSPGEAKDLSQYWMPSAFSHLSGKQFEAFLVELVGLGVLKQMSDGRYAIRNINVLKLLANDINNDISDRLEKAVEELASYDPLDRHSFDSQGEGKPLPITCRDEKSILGSKASDQGSSSYIKLDTSRFTVTIISGSDALGLSQVPQTLPVLHADEVLGGPLTLKKKYKPYEISTSHFETPLDFQNKLLTPLLSTRVKESAQMVFVTIDSSTSLANLLGMIDAAHAANQNSHDLPNPVRLIFLMGPQAYWNWLSRPDLTAIRESLQPFIRLSLWTTDAIRSLLERLGLNDSTTATDEVRSITDGWYFSLCILVELSRKNDNWRDISQFSPELIPLTEIAKKDVTKLCKLTGLESNKDTFSVLKEVHRTYGSEPIDFDVIELMADEAGVEDLSKKNIERITRWLCDLSLLTRIRSSGKGGLQYCLPKSIDHALKIISQDE